MKPLPEFPEMKVPETKPLRMALYNVLDFGADPLWYHLLPAQPVCGFK
jgi:hypothetical protein